MTKPLSSIQNNIISRLKNADQLRYSDLKPDKIPNDLFNYHLQYLVKNNLVKKISAGNYSLSEKGVKHVADPHTNDGAITSLFKINVITIVSRKVEDQIEILNQHRKSNPSYGKVGVMGGVVLKGETLEDAATRKLEQETGLNAFFKIVGCERRIMYRSGELFSDVMFPIAYSNSVTGNLMKTTEFGENFWVPIDEAIKNDSAEFDSLKIIPKVLKAVKNDSLSKAPFLFMEDVQSN